MKFKVRRAPAGFRKCIIALQNMAEKQENTVPVHSLQALQLHRPPSSSNWQDAGKPELYFQVLHPSGSLVT